MYYPYTQPDLVINLEESEDEYKCEDKYECEE